MGKVGSSPAFRRNNRENPHPPKADDADTPADISDLESMDTAALKLHLEREALLVTARIMRKPLRNAQAVLGAARDLGTYCISKPAQATTLSGPDGGAVQVTHRLEFIEPN
jgi:hypothetical protein